MHGTEAYSGPCQTYMTVKNFVVIQTVKQSIALRKSVQIRSFYWSVFSRIWAECGPEKTPYLNIFRAVSQLPKY